jgi:transcriptional regulator with XRE-family HTH domain
MASFSVRLREARKARGLLQKNIAGLLSVTERHIRSYEAGEVDPPLSKAIALADYFDVSLDYLCGLSDDPERR